MVRINRAIGFLLQAALCQASYGCASTKVAQEKRAVMKIVQRGKHEMVINAAQPLLGTLVTTVLLTLWLAAIGWIDAKSLRIPDALSLPLIGLGIIWAAVQPETSALPNLIGAAVGYGVLALIGYVYFAQTGSEGLGLGDAKLFSAAGAWLGWQALPQVLLFAATTGLIFALVLKGLGASRPMQIAFGPWLALGLWVVWIWQRLVPLA